MFRIKICGVTHRLDVVVACALGADAVGFNFFDGSKRYLSPAMAPAVVSKIPERVVKVGVFVNSPAKEVCQVFDRLRLDLIQLSGDEPPGYLSELGRRPVMKAIRYSAEGLRAAQQYVAAGRKLGLPPAAILIDSAQPGQFGGTGVAVDWRRLRSDLDAGPFGDLPIVLAGGLTPSNVGEAIATIRPAAVDVASGVEYAPGRKDAVLVDQFIAAAQAAFAKNGE
jgi:phosphoribosylanthranilate isomerase